mgnify:CR=1 FL=1|tara:strand:- start:1007 stop:1465 length:459 start_codon:yes stop_codon:yes gene_type:complete
MKFISHRGNINGKISKRENEIDYVEKAISLGYDVEIDIFFYKQNFWTGHDKPKNKVKNKKLLTNKKIWMHAKNIDAAYELSKIKNAHFFWHQNDDIVLTSKSILWTYPGKQLTNNSVCVLPELDKKMSIKKIKKCFGVCSDYIQEFKYRLTK